MKSKTLLDLFEETEEEIPPVKQYSGAKRCIHCGCKLSVYNDSDTCAPCQKAGKKSKLRKALPRSKYRGVLEELPISTDTLIIGEGGGDDMRKIGGDGG